MVTFANINVYPITLQESISKVEGYVKSNRYHYQISLNAGKIVEAQKDEKLLKIINSADILNADGMPIKVIIQFLFGRHTDRLGGLDYMDGLALKYPEYKYYFLGSTEDVVLKTVNHYRSKYNMNIVGWRNGFFKKNELVDLINDINQKETDILFVAMGTPAKEYFLYDNKELLKCKFAVGVGGAFNIIAGVSKRAPYWVQKIGMEWFYRFIQEPRRMWYRYLVGNSKFIWLVIKENIKNHTKIDKYN
jgi:N-acetylglucosaminyldiphosphoundecaprenol N-acetyl-beta-D-mannosaminyltransferase